MNLKPVIFDIDGVLADFTKGFTTLGRTVFGTPVQATHNHAHWNDLGGMTHEQQAHLWSEIAKSNTFWSGLPALVDGPTWIGIARLMRERAVYFVTNRYGWHAKEQTEAWLEFHLHRPATVVLSKRKGEIARAVNAGYALEDKAANASCIAWMTDDQTKSYLIDRMYNRCDEGFLASSVRRVATVEEFLNAIDKDL